MLKSVGETITGGVSHLNKPPEVALSSDKCPPTASKQRDEDRENNV